MKTSAIVVFYGVRAAAPPEAGMAVCRLGKLRRRLRRRDAALDARGASGPVAVATGNSERPTARASAAVILNRPAGASIVCADAPDTVHQEPTR